MIKRIELRLNEKQTRKFLGINKQEFIALKNSQAMPPYLKRYSRDEKKWSSKHLRIVLKNIRTRQSFFPIPSRLFIWGSKTTRI